MGRAYPHSLATLRSDDAEAVPQGTTLEYSHRVRGVQPEQFIDTLTHELQRRAHRPLSSTAPTSFKDRSAAIIIARDHEAGTIAVFIDER